MDRGEARAARLPRGFERRVVEIAPGDSHVVVPAEWRGVLVLVLAGEIEVVCRGGARGTFIEGDILWLAGLSVRLVRNRAAEAAVLEAWSRPRRDELRRAGRSEPTDTPMDTKEPTMTTNTTDAVSTLREQLRGAVIEPGDAGYEDARQVFYGGFDRRPAAIARVASADDVARVIEVARTSGLELAVRSGGHSVAGQSVTEGGIVLDLSGMKATEIDPGSRTVWAETGLTASELASAIAEHGLAVGFGDTGSVGIGGITLGGGVGFLSRKYGLTIDDLLAAELVTADGEVLQASERSHPDLFWAIRGGGGNFGVATRFRYRVHELPRVYGGMLMLPASVETVSRFLELADAAPEELTTIVNVMPAPPMPFVPAEHHGRPTVIAFVCFAGTGEEGERALAPFRAIAEPLADMVREVAYPELYPPEDPNFHPLAWGENLLVDAIDRAAVETIVERVEAAAPAFRVAQIRPLGGAVARVPNDATAYAHRDRPYMVNVGALIEAPEQRDDAIAWVHETATRIQRGPVAAYVNFLEDEGQDRVRSAYPGPTWDRLLEVKRRYDPDNLFRLNQNIREA
jgi:FAD/FMN-containing dehydrogenase